MRKILAICILVCLAGAAVAQPNEPAGGSFHIQSWDEWVNDNIDPDVLQALQQLDQERVKKIFSEWQQAMAGTNLDQLATLRDAAKQWVPILQKFEETAPYAVWLQTRLDYLEAAQELKRPTNALPLSPGEALKLERRIWARQLEKRPWPPLAQTYVPRLKEVFISERVPPELVWVAEVESSFNPSARSPAGAAGMFQLMPQTARDEDLSLWPFDQRYQPEKSARAAAKYLRSLYLHYGNWPLALAAYNSGAGRVDRLLKQQKGKSFETIARRLPAETQMYVPKVEATVQKREGRNLAELRLLAVKN